MQTKVQIQMPASIVFEVEHDVKTLGDLRKLLKKADAKIAAACKAVPELGDMQLVKARIAVEQPKTAAAAS